MRTVELRVDGSGLLNYAAAGRKAVGEVRKTVRQLLNLGRKEARQKIGAEFTPRTGFLRRQARRMQTKATVSRSEVRGRVSPLPRLLNIFEGGATLAYGRGRLRPRPVVGPAQEVMVREARTVFDRLLKQVGT